MEKLPTLDLICSIRIQLSKIETLIMDHSAGQNPEIIRQLTVIDNRCYDLLETMITLAAKELDLNEKSD